MFWWVTAALRQTILQRFEIDAKELDGLLGSVLHEEQAKLVSKTGELNIRGRHGEINALVDKLKQGDVRGFTQSIAQLAGIDVKTAARIVSDASGEPLAVLAKAIGADRAQVTTIFLQLDYKRHGKGRPLAQIETVARLYDAVPSDRAISAVSLWDAQVLGAAA